MRCSLNVEIEGGKVKSVKGNTCKHGEEYANDECISSMRTFTTTVMCVDGTPIPVKTDKPITKEKIFECMEFISSAAVNTPVSVG